jgi:hypothetical protein
MDIAVPSRRQLKMNEWDLARSFLKTQQAKGP